MNPSPAVVGEADQGAWEVRFPNSDHGTTPIRPSFSNFSIITIRRDGA